MKNKNTCVQKLNHPQGVVEFLVGAHETLINNNQPYAKTLLKISVFARLLIVHLRIGHAPLRALTDPCAQE